MCRRGFLGARGLDEASESIRGGSMEKGRSGQPRREEQSEGLRLRERVFSDMKDLEILLPNRHVVNFEDGGVDMATTCLEDVPRTLLKHAKETQLKR